MIEATPLWSDDAILAAHKTAFGANPDVGLFALFTWIRDEYEAALAAKAAEIAKLRESNERITGFYLAYYEEMNRLGEELAETRQTSDEFATKYLMAENSKDHWKKKHDEAQAIIKYIDDYAPRADSSCVKPGISLSQAAKNAMDELTGRKAGEAQGE